MTSIIIRKKEHVKMLQRNSIILGKKNMLKSFKEIDHNNIE